MSDNNLRILSSKSWRIYIHKIIAKEVSNISRYFDKVIQFAPLDHDNGLLLGYIDCKLKNTVYTLDEFPNLAAEKAQRTAILLNGTLNHNHDIQGILTSLKPKLSRTSRIIIIAYNSYLAWLYRVTHHFKILNGNTPTTFLTRTDLDNISKLSGFEIVRFRPTAYFPWKLGGLGNIINSFCTIIPIVREMALTTVVTLRPIVPDKEKPSLTILIPARNEKGNIENALNRMPDFGCKTEIIYVEGNSTDDTWAEIQRVENEYKTKFNIKIFKQPGKGKGDAVRFGFSKSECDLLTILDADLTMPPEMLTRYYDAYTSGLADFINGSRLVYPMEGQAMRFLNWLANNFFAKVLSFVLDTKLGDSLCGTKLMTRHDYERMKRWRDDFGDFDPFGDFEIIFPAAILGLGIIDIPIRYRDRTYGSTNIRRFRDGLTLLKMTLVGLLKVKKGPTP